MEVKDVKTKVTRFVKNNKYILLIVIVGVMLMLIPNSKKGSTVNKQMPINAVSTDTIEKRLTETLSQIKGVGKVKVMLTVAEGESRVYQTDWEESRDDKSTKDKSNTVIVSDSDRVQNGLLLQENPPTYKGAIIVCQGGDDPKTKLAVTEAVSKITGLRTSSISVLKMK